MSSTATIPGNGAGGTASIGRVIVVEDQRLVAEFFTYHCRDLGLEVVERCGTCREGLIAIRAHRPDLVLMDISLPDGDGLELAKTILDELPEVKILAISSHRDPWTMLQVQRIGLHGFVDKNEQRPEVLTEAIHAVLAGRVYYTPIVNESSASIRRDPKAFIRVLSDYETRVLSLIGESKTDEEIATILSISPATVQSRRRDIMSKLDVHTTPKLIHYAIVNGLTRVEQLGQKKPT
ncbi:MAG: response regulator transcription factor [bacterium]|nr:response regulator transcription factor [bacterium]MDI1337400.1 response regulator transcription factor [Lacunisphaera sp.]